MNSIDSSYISSQQGSLSSGTERLPRLNLFYFEGASYEASRHQKFSEDFASYQYKDECLYFVVCDGVGQSVDADLAARLLGMDILKVLPTVLGDKKALESFANEIGPDIEKTISSTPIDINNPYYRFHMRLRDEVGSQVKFACGVVDFKRGKIDLYWAGDVFFAVYGNNSEIMFFWDNDNGQFWSTKGNTSLTLSSQSWDIDDVSRLSITSDGIRTKFEEILTQELYLNEISLINHIYKIGIDDISGIDIQIVSADNVEQLPNLAAVGLVNNNTLTWTPLLQAEKYRIYYVQNDSIQRTLDVSNNQTTFLLSDEYDDGDFYIQGISSQAFSSKLSEPIYFTPKRTSPKLDTIEKLDGRIRRKHTEYLNEKSLEEKPLFNNALTIITGVITVLSLTVGIAVGLSGGNIIFKISTLISVILILVGIYLIYLANESKEQRLLYVDKNTTRMVPVFHRTGKKRDRLLLGGWGSIVIGILSLALAFVVVPDSPILTTYTPTITATLTSTPTITPTFTVTASSTIVESPTPTVSLTKMTLSATPNP